MAPKRKIESLTIRENRELCPGYYRVVFEAHTIARVCYPGQFCMLRLPGVLLGRPLSIAAAGKQGLEFIYRVVGAGTRVLSGLKKGEKVMVLGPLGAGYPLPRPKGTKIPILVAGGTGIASLQFLALTIRKPGILFYGAKSRKDFVCLDAFRKRGWKVFAATEDGSAGAKGFVTDALGYFLRDHTSGAYTAYVCGPHRMMERAAVLLREHGIGGYASLEERMACGVGNCQGCATKIGNEYRMVCKDGPVFAIDEITWEDK